MNNLELVPQKELDTLAKYNAELKETAAALMEVAKNSAGLKFPATGSGAGTPASSRPKPDAQVTALEKELNKLYAERERLMAQVTAAVQKEVNANAVLKESRRQATADAKIAAKEMLATANSVDALRAKIPQLAKAWASLDMDSPEFAQAGKDLAELRNKVTQAEMSVGQFGRNVGNYASGFGQLGSQVQQVAREFPSLAVSPQQFFLAISNNIPMLQDSIRLTKQLNEEQKALGKTVVPVGTQIFKSIFSWQSAVVVLLTVLSSPILKDWISNLFKGRDAALDAAGAIKKVGEAMDVSDFGQKLANFKRLSELYAEIGDNAKAKERFLKDYREELDETGISIKNVNEADNLFIRNSTAFVAALKLRAQMTAAEGLASEEYGKALKEEVKNQEEMNKLIARRDELQSKSSDYTERRVVGSGTSSSGAVQSYTANIPLQTLLKENTDEITALNKKRDALNTTGDAYNDLALARAKAYDEALSNAGLTELDGGARNPREERDRINLSARMSNLNAERKAAEDLSVSEIDEHIGVINRTLAADKSSIAERIALTNDLYDLQEQRIRQLAKTQEDNLVQQNIDENTTYKKDGSVDSTIDEVTARGNVANQIKALQMVTNQALIDSDADRINEINALEDEGIQYRIRALQMEFQKRANMIDQDESDELAALSTRYAKGEMTQQEYEDARLATTRKYAILRQNTELGMMQAVLAEMRSDTNLTEAQLQEIANYEQSIADLRVQINKDANDQKTKDNEKAAADAKKLEEAQRDFSQKMASEMLEFVSTLVKAATERRLAALEEQLEAAQAYADEEQERIERLAEAGAISEEQKNARIALSEQQLKEREDDIENQKREAQVRQAKYEKAQAIIQSQIATALSISTSAQMGFPAAIPFIAMAAALGAIQLATIMATPIPQYARGTEDHPGGLAWVGDGGRSEMVIMGGKAYKSPAVPTLIDLPKGAEVLPDYNQAVRDFAIANALTPIRQSDVPSGRGSAPYNDTMVLARLGDANHRLHKLTELTEMQTKAIKQQGSDRRFKELGNRYKSII